MRILLISPKATFTTNLDDLRTFWGSFSEHNPNMNLWSGISTALLTVAALTPDSIDVDFIDENVDLIDFNGKYDLVGISVMTLSAIHSYKISKEFRKRGVKVVMGGVHPTILPEEAILHADSVVIGEAEYVWGEVLQDAKNGTLKKYYKSKKLIDLEHSPIPRYDLINGEKYRYIWLQTSRGCPHDCDFCTASKIFGKGYRTKPISNVKAEIQTIKRLFKYKPISFSDDNFLVNKKYSLNLLEMMQELDVKWQAQCDVSIGMRKELLQLMKKSGCLLVFIGLESLSTKSLSDIDSNGWKLNQLNNYADYISNIQSSGIGAMGAFIVGFDGDDISTFKNIENFVVDNHLYHASYTILTPLPGTKIRNYLQKNNRLLNTNWENYTGYCVNFKPKNMSIKELETGLTELYKRTYTKELFYKNMTYFKEIHKNL